MSKIKDDQWYADNLTKFFKDVVYTTNQLKHESSYQTDEWMKSFLGSIRKIKKKIINKGHTFEINVSPVTSKDIDENIIRKSTKRKLKITITHINGKKSYKNITATNVFYFIPPHFLI